VDLQLAGTTVLVTGAGRSASGRHPAEVGTPRRSWRKSFRRNGTPANLPDTAPAAWRRARTSRRLPMALIDGFSRSARASACSRTSVADASPSVTRSARPSPSRFVYSRSSMAFPRSRSMRGYVKPRCRSPLRAERVDRPCGSSQRRSAGRLRRIARFAGI